MKKLVMQNSNENIQNRILQVVIFVPKKIKLITIEDVLSLPEICF